MGITSAGMQSRDADCGRHTHTRTVQQIQQNTTVHYLLSPPRSLHQERTHKPKLRFNPAGSGDTKKTSCAFCLSKIIRVAGGRQRSESPGAYRSK
ncbi:TPA: hypothetical protein N2R15_004937 [Citrobacter amalonaticus]|nr:hypothetical protein [Citrobacter amalonaticus]